MTYVRGNEAGMRQRRQVTTGDLVRSGGTDETDRITGTVRHVDYGQQRNGTGFVTVEMIYVDWPDLTPDDSGIAR